MSESKPVGGDLLADLRSWLDLYARRVPNRGVAEIVLSEHVIELCEREGVDVRETLVPVARLHGFDDVVVKPA